MRYCRHTVATLAQHRETGCIAFLLRRGGQYCISTGNAQVLSLFYHTGNAQALSLFVYFCLQNFEGVLTFGEIVNLSREA